MASSLRDRLDGVPRKPAAMRGETVHLRGEGVRNRIAADEARLAGRLLADAILNAKLTNQQAADRLGIHPSAPSRWKSGAEIPALVVRWIADPVMRRGLIVALADLPDDDVETEVLIRVGRKVSA